MRVLLGVLLEGDNIEGLALAIEASLSQQFPSFGQHTLAYYELTLNVIKQELVIGEQVVSLTNKETSLLEVMMRSPETFLTRRYLIDRIYSPGHHMVERSIDSHFTRIRNKLPERYRDWFFAKRNLGHALVQKTNTAP